MDRMDYL